MQGCSYILRTEDGINEYCFNVCLRPIADEHTLHRCNEHRTTTDPPVPSPERLDDEERRGIDAALDVLGGSQPVGFWPTPSGFDASSSAVFLRCLVGLASTFASRLIT